MFKLLFLFLIILNGSVFSNEEMPEEGDNDIVDTEALFRDPSLSLKENSNFVNFKYLDKVPEFVAPIVNGGNFQLSDYVGDLQKDEKLKRYYERYQEDPRKTLVIVFFASYCEPCKDQIPEVLDVVESLSSERDDMQLLFVGMDANKKLIDAYVELQNFSWPQNSVVVLNPPRNKISPSSVLKVNKLPSLYILNREGKVILEHHGYKRESNTPLIIETIINNYDGIEKYSE